MTRLVRMASVASALAFLLPLAGCSDFDPQDLLDNIMSSQKKPLEGERKPLFPTGTPGVRQGLPPELVKGYQAPTDPAPDETAQVPTDQPKQKPKPKPKPKVAAAPPANAPAPASAAPQPAAAQASPWPNPPATRQSAAPGGVVWPDPPPVTR